MVPDADGLSDYSRNDVVRKVLTPVGAKENGLYIHAHMGANRAEGHLLFDRPTLKAGQALVRPLRMGGKGHYERFNNTHTIYAKVVNFNVGGRAFGTGR